MARIVVKAANTLRRKWLRERGERGSQRDYCLQVFDSAQLKGALQGGVRVAEMGPHMVVAPPAVSSWALRRSAQPCMSTRVTPQASRYERAVVWEVAMQRTSTQDVAAETAG